MSNASSGPGPSDVRGTAPSIESRASLQAEEDRELNRLLASLNESSGSARTSWMFFLGLMAYFLVAIASVSHQDLLLNRPVHLPFLDIEIELDKFFRFSPLVLLIIHFGVYQQHVLLSRKADRVHDLLSAYETAAGLPPRGHPMRLRVHSYFFTQIDAGPQRSRIFKIFLIWMDALSFVILPILLLLAFQLSFLAYHDEAMTTWHRFYLFFDVLLIFLMQQFIWDDEESKGLIRTTIDLSARALKYIPSLVVLAISWLVATIPDEPADKFMTRLAGVPVPFEYQFGFSGSCHRVLGTSWRPVCNTLFGEPTVKLDTARPVREAFVLTAVLFEGEVDYGLGESRSWFSRNLIVPDRDLSVARTQFQKSDTQSNALRNDADTITTERVKLSLRGRDLRYAVFDRSNFTGADFTLANLEGASFKGAILTDATISCAVKPLRSETGGEFKECAKLYAAQFDGAVMHRADLRGACALGTSFKSADLRASSLFKASLIGADLTLALLNGAVLAEARMQGSKMLGAEFRGASLRFANLQRLDPRLIKDEDVTSVYDDCIDNLPAWVERRILDDAKANDGRTNVAQADLELVDLRLANLQGADLTRARLRGADLHLSQMQGVELTKADLQGADISYASLQGSDLSNAQLDGALLVETKLNGAVMRAARLWAAHLDRAQLSGADFRFARLEGATLDGATLKAADFRCTRLPDATQVQQKAPNLELTDLHGARQEPINPSERARIEHEAKSYVARRLALRHLKFDSNRARLAGQREERWDQPSVVGNVQVDLENETQGPLCPDGTSLNPTQQSRLSTELANIICEDEPNVEFIARGVARRIVASDAKDIPKYQSNPAVLLSAIKALSVGGRPISDNQATPKQPACLTRIGSRDLFGLSLLAARSQQKN